VFKSIERIEERTRQIAASAHLGTIGERIEIAVKVDRVSSFTRPRFAARWQNETVWIITMRDKDGHAIVSKSPSFHAEKGEEFTIKAAIKDHSEFNDEKQTIVNRIKILVS